jgi:hypothetical protein
MFSLVKARWVFVYGALLLSLANGVYGEGTYQRTKDGKTVVWNNSPRPHEAARWSGDRDADEYGKGHGTLTWYTAREVIVTGSNIPSAKYTPIVRYSGNMIRGKLEGPVVSVDANGETFHCTFVGGRRVGKWVAGPAPGPSRTGISDQRGNEHVPRAELIEVPAEGPTQKSEIREPATAGKLRSELTDQEASKHDSGPAVTEKPGPASDSLRLLTAPPSSLRVNLVAEPSPGLSRLAEAEVIALADAEARMQGYELGEYQRPQAHYTAADDTWSVFYDQKFVDGMGEVGKHFSVSVEDKTKKTSIIAGR